jgi:hypothetical protein
MFMVTILLKIFIIIIIILYDFFWIHIYAWHV